MTLNPFAVNAALEGDGINSLKTAMAQCKKAFEAGPPKSAYLERPLILDLPQPNVRVTINLVGE